MDSDPTADLTDDDVRRVLDEADAAVGAVPDHGGEPEYHRSCVVMALGGRNNQWSAGCRRAVARLRAERAERGTP